MGAILRKPGDAASRHYDLIIVGGGIYGVMLLLEAAIRGLCPLLLERDDFGQHTSFNNLRIIHGGLRYLQKLDLPRFYESVFERKWFLRYFPGHVRPLPCLMPLYGKGLRRKNILRAALAINHLLSYNRNKGMHTSAHLPSGGVISAEETQKLFPMVVSKGLEGSALWYDAFMTDSQLLLIDVLKRACDFGATAINYMEVTELCAHSNIVNGVKAYERKTGYEFGFRAPVVVNAAGPWSRGLAERFDRDEPALFKSSLLWNLLLDRPAPSSHALAIVSNKQNARTYFLLPWRGKLLAGTGHAPWNGAIDKPIPNREQVGTFLAELNDAAPLLALNPKQIIRVFSGLLPVKHDGSVKLKSRPVIIDHGKRGGPSGLYSVSGVKFTTARRVAEKVLNRIYAKKGVPLKATIEHILPPHDTQDTRGVFPANWYPTQEDKTWQNNIRKIIREESVLHLDDLIFRRTNLWDNPSRAMLMAPLVSDLFDWNESQRAAEIDNLGKALGHESSANSPPISVIKG